MAILSRFRSCFVEPEGASGRVSISLPGVLRPPADKLRSPEEGRCFVVIGQVEGLRGGDALTQRGLGDPALHQGDEGAVPVLEDQPAGG